MATLRAHRSHRGRRAGRLVAAAVVLLAVPLPAPGEWQRGGERAGSEVSLEGGNGSWLVRATINGRLRGTFLLDTGASFCVVTPAAADRLGLAPGAQEVTLRTANGLVRAPLVQLASVEVGGMRAPGVQAVVHGAVDPPLDGVIGLSFLNRFSYQVVPSRRVLKLH